RKVRADVSHFFNPCLNNETLFAAWRAAHAANANGALYEALASKALRNVLFEKQKQKVPKNVIALPAKPS
ncbi:MAG: hypothetical protein ACFNZS_12830, partial [Ottowia sp.]